MLTAIAVAPCTTFIGFDSAWADSPKAPGTICAIRFGYDGVTAFQPPQLVDFLAAAAFIRQQSGTDGGATLIAIDQPTIVPNDSGIRPVERVAASLISWVGGGVQPSNRRRIGFFDEAAPIWRFRSSLPLIEDPMVARSACIGLHLMEVFPALALVSLSESFFGRLLGPRYNPTRRSTFRQDQWLKVYDVVIEEAERLGCAVVADWLRAHRDDVPIRKADQDRLDSIICVLVAIRWRRDPLSASMMIGDLQHGYIVTPASLSARHRLTGAAARYGVPVSNGV